MATQKLQGLIAAPFTPMHPDGSLNLAVIPAYYEPQINAPVTPFAFNNS